MKIKLLSGLMMFGLTTITFATGSVFAATEALPTPAVTATAAPPATATVPAKTIAALPTYQCVGQDDGEIFLSTNPDQCVRDGFFVEGIVDTGS